MHAIPVITGDADLFSRIAGLMKADGVAPIPLHDPDQALEFLSLEMPELYLMNFSDARFDPFALLETIMADPWLLHGGILALCDDYDATKRIEKLRSANIVAVIGTKGMDRNLRLVMEIIRNNRRILFQRQIGADIVQNITGHFKLRNDPLEANCYVNLICNFLYNSNRLDLDSKSSLNLALEEMLMNAIEHGNCGITYEQKTAWLDDGGTIGDLIEQRCQDPDTGKKRVTFEYGITPTCSRFLIADEGKGFNWREVKDPRKKENVLKQHGRGILMTRAFTQNLAYNEEGNEVRFEIEHQKDVASSTPGLIKHIEPREVKEGEIIFRQGEQGNFLHYIASGRYDVIVNDKVVASLAPDDIFMGEMAFLLNDRRSATVRAATNGRLIQVSKKEFVEAIKRKPHYALLLSRLLAQRLERLSKRSAQMDS